jgi:hypothetical protein
MHPVQGFTWRKAVTATVNKPGKPFLKNAAICSAISYTSSIKSATGEYIEHL